MKSYKMTPLGKLSLVMVAAAMLTLVVSAVFLVSSFQSPASGQDASPPADSSPGVSPAGSPSPFDSPSNSPSGSPLSSPSASPSSETTPSAPPSPAETHPAPSPSVSPKPASTLGEILTVPFERNSAALSGEAGDLVKSYVANKDYLYGYSLVVEGCSFMSEDSGISIARAQAVADCMTGNGVPASSIYMLSRVISAETGEDALKVTVYYMESQSK